MTAANTRHVAPLIAGLWLALAGMAAAAVPDGKPGLPQGKPVTQGKPVVPQAQPGVVDGKPVLPGKPAKPPKHTHPMQVLIVSDSRPGCEPDCAEWISAEGEIGPETPAQFRRVFKLLGHKKLPIFITSNGGSVPHAFAIGREIRKRGLDVAVERTLFEKCQTGPAPCDKRSLKDGDKGRPEPIAANCVSSCVFILAAGTERLVPVYGFVGVHQLTAFQTYKLVQRMYQVRRKFENWHFVQTRELVGEKQLSTTTVEKDPNYGPSRAYFAEMGIDAAKIMPLLLSTPHEDVHRMTADERRETGIVTRFSAGHVLLPAAGAIGAAAGGAATAGGKASAATESAAPIGAATAVTASADPTVPAAVAGAAAPTGLAGAEVPASEKTKLPPAVAQKIAALSDVSAGLLVLHPPRENVIELYLRLKSKSGAPVRAEEWRAEIQLANGKKLAASSTGEDIIDPLYTTLSRADYCMLRDAGDLSLKVALMTTALPGWRQRLQFDAAKVVNDAEFAAKYCR